jgi:hypothetical protein
MLSRHALVQAGVVPVLETVPEQVAVSSCCASDHRKYSLEAQGTWIMDWTRADDIDLAFTSVTINDDKTARHRHSGNTGPCVVRAMDTPTALLH